MFLEAPLSQGNYGISKQLHLSLGASSDRHSCYRVPGDPRPTSYSSCYCSARPPFSFSQQTIPTHMVRLPPLVNLMCYNIEQCHVMCRRSRAVHIKGILAEYICVVLTSNDRLSPGDRVSPQRKDVRSRQTTPCSVVTWRG